VSESLKDGFQHVVYGWNDAVAEKLEPVERLVYRSNLLGSDQRITNTGGGNTSSKLVMSDPLTKEGEEVLWVKGSGGDLRTSKRGNFASLYMSKLEELKAIYDRAGEKGSKSASEDEMVALYPHAVYDLNPRASSIDTPLHAFIPHKHVDHTHPNAAIAVAASRNSEALTHEIYGDEVGWVAWQRPGFDLGLVMEAAVRAEPKLKGLIMGQHGLINWDDDDKACYELTLRLIERAARYIETHDRGEATFGGQRYTSLWRLTARRALIEVLPKLRGMVSKQARFSRHGAVGPDDPALRQQRRRAAAE
jgi:rhamnose utilization protein RhaD (predicted bifunctional aldolase and dehydrogenase)